MSARGGRLERIMYRYVTGGFDLVALFGGDFHHHLLASLYQVHINLAWQ